MKSRRTPLRHHAAALLALLLLCAAPWAAAQDDGAPTPVDFTLAMLGGGEQSLAALRGQWVVLNYWATWCGPCRKEIPDLSALHDRNERITVLGLAYEEASEAEFRAFLADNPATFPILLVDVYDPPQPFGPPKVLPTTIVLDPQGRPVETFVGPVTGEQIERFVEDHREP
ncbi:MAG: TlpA disulfide reductase family protein [Gammaproteobacteria bacterium]